MTLGVPMGLITTYLDIKILHREDFLKSDSGRRGGGREAHHSRVGAVTSTLGGMTRTALDFDDNWLDPEELAQIRRRLPLTYVHGLPVRRGDDGQVESVGLLLRTLETGVLGREIVGGRVKFHESLRTALMRHAEKDLGPLSLPSPPLSLTPFHVAEYFPTEGESRHYDPRQHAVALCYILLINGDCSPHGSALSLDWLSPHEAASDEIAREMRHGQEHIVRAGLAHLGLLP